MAFLLKNSRFTHCLATHRAMFILAAKSLFALCFYFRKVQLFCTPTPVISECQKRLLGYLNQQANPLEWKSTQFSTICWSQNVGYRLQLADLDQSLNLSYGFILLKENNSSISKSPPNMKIAVWDLTERFQFANKNKTAKCINKSG